MSERDRLSGGWTTEYRVVDAKGRTTPHPKLRTWAAAQDALLAVAAEYPAHGPFTVQCREIAPWREVVS